MRAFFVCVFFPSKSSSVSLSCFNNNLYMYMTSFDFGGILLGERIVIIVIVGTPHAG
jgi:hypothetical protein